MITRVAIITPWIGEPEIELEIDRLGRGRRAAGGGCRHSDGCRQLQPAQGRPQAAFRLGTGHRCRGHECAHCMGGGQV